MDRLFWGQYVFCIFWLYGHRSIEAQAIVTDPYPNCQDSVNFNCSTEVCSFDSAFHICQKTCDFCDHNPSEHACVDLVLDLKCEDLPNPCADSLGMMSCPLFCGLCGTLSSTITYHNNISPQTTITQVSTTPPATTTSTKTTSAIPPTTATTTSTTTPSAIPLTTTTSTTTPSTTTTATSTTTTLPSCNLINKHQLGSSPAEIVFMMEVSNLASWCDIDNEGDFIITMMDQWGVHQNSQRVGLVLYKDTSTEAIHINDFQNNDGDLKTQIHKLTGHCGDHEGTLHRGGEANLAKALQYVGDNAFNNARTGVPKVVIPIIHDMPNSQVQLEEIINSAQQLKDNCTSIIGIVVYNEDANGNDHGHHDAAGLNWATIVNTVNHPYGDFLWTVDKFSALDQDYHNCNYGFVSDEDVGCSQAEVVFMVEYAAADEGHCGIEHQGDFIAKVIGKWNIEHTGTRCAIVFYHDTVEELIHLDDYANNTSGLKAAIHNITGINGQDCHTNGLDGSGIANFTKAMDFVREHSFSRSRPGVPQVVIPIIHDAQQDHNSMIAASQRVKDQCISVLPLLVTRHLHIRITVEKISSTDPNKHYRHYDDFQQLENDSENYGRKHC